MAMNASIQSRRLLPAVLAAACSVGAAFGLCRMAATGPVPIPEPQTGPSAEHGRRLFVQSCAHCHGDDARGSGEDGDGPDLFGLRIGNARIAAVISTGIPEEMPSFAKKHGAADVADLTAYLRTIR